MRNTRHLIQLLFMEVLFLTPFVSMGQDTKNMQQIAVFVHCDKSISTPMNALRANLTSYLVNGAKDDYIVLDRSDEILDLLKQEYSYQGSGIVRDDQIITIGDQLGANIICAVSITHYAEYNQFFFECKMININTTQVLIQANYPDTEIGQNVVRSLSPQVQVKVAKELATMFGYNSFSIGDVFKTERVIVGGFSFDVLCRVGYLDKSNLHGFAYGVIPRKTDIPRSDTPTLSQLRLLYQNRESLGLFGEYWSQDETIDERVYYTMDFSTGKIHKRQAVRNYSLPYVSLECIVVVPF